MRTLDLQDAKEENKKIKENDFEARMDANREISIQRQVGDILNLNNKGRRQK